MNVYHGDLYGLREEKYEALNASDVESTVWERIEPRSPKYLLTPRDYDLLGEYRRGVAVDEVFPLGQIGLNSHRDSFAVCFAREDALSRVHDIASEAMPTDKIKELYSLRNTHDFNVREAREELQQLETLSDVVVPCLYRPFDWRFLLYHSAILDRPRQRLNVHFLKGSNLGLATTRQTREPFSALAVSKICGQHKIAAKYDGSYIYPLFLYSPNEGETVGSFIVSEFVIGKVESLLRETERKRWLRLVDEESNRAANFHPDFVEALEQTLGLEWTAQPAGDLKRTFGPEDVFCYIYAVFHSPTFRNRYEEFLKTDFPRVPITSGRELFRTLRKKGDALVRLHLMEHPALEHFITRYPVSGSDEIESGHPKYYAPGETAAGADEPLSKGRVYISQDHPRQGTTGQYFEGVPPEVWEFQVGGYQVLHKWLYDRRRADRPLDYDDIRHYQKIVVALKETIRLMDDIDNAIQARGGWPIE